MSSRLWLFRLEDILDSLERIQQYIQDINLQEFKSDQRTIDAVVRNLEVIGEAARYIPESIVEEYPDVPWKYMRDMRNVLIHEYFGIHTEIIWQTITHDLPLLKTQLKKIIRDKPPKSNE